MEHPRQKHQTQPIYTAPRLSDRFDRQSPLNNRRSMADNYHETKSSMQNTMSGRQNNKTIRHHSTNAYNAAPSNQKELSPTSNSQQSQQNSNSSR